MVGRFVIDSLDCVFFNLIVGVTIFENNVMTGVIEVIGIGLLVLILVTELLHITHIGIDKLLLVGCRAIGSLGQELPATRNHWLIDVHLFYLFRIDLLLTKSIPNLFYFRLVILPCLVISRCSCVELIRCLIRPLLLDF